MEEGELSEAREDVAALFKSQGLAIHDTSPLMTGAHVSATRERMTMLLKPMAIMLWSIMAMGGCEAAKAVFNCHALGLILTTTILAQVDRSKIIIKITIRIIILNILVRIYSLVQ